ncbi:quinoprotein relay system zinc metallohydrolase 1 [Rhodovulum sp. DZ06]|uniref:quinoprotein relay system zinc metallohydrolase 1 n=1 Tax=Rhodovulum sp. DZ06 TaxID=3425126 RepID=UPI003D3597BE
MSGGPSSSSRRPSRRAALGLLAAAPAALSVGLGAALAPARVFAAARHVYDLAPRQVADGIWMVEGATEYFTRENGGAIVNIALVETPRGVIVVDTGPSRRYGEALRAAAQLIHPLGAQEALITHHHPDHFFGNQVFADLPIRALGPTGLMATQMGDAYADNLYRMLGDWMRGTEPTPPTRVLQPGPVEILGRRFQALALKGHTASDLALLDEATGVLIAGDLAFLDRAPTTPDADIAEWRASIAALDALSPAAVIPGHGPFDPARASLRQTDAYLEWLDARLRRAAADGLDMMDIIREGPPGRFASLGAMPQELSRSTAHLFPTIEREVLPRAN